MPRASRRPRFAERDSHAARRRLARSLPHASGRRPARDAGRTTPIASVVSASQALRQARDARALASAELGSALCSGHGSCVGRCTWTWSARGPWGARADDPGSNVGPEALTGLTACVKTTTTADAPSYGPSLPLTPVNAGVLSAPWGGVETPVDIFAIAWNLPAGKNPGRKKNRGTKKKFGLAQLFLKTL